jgi:hypothetical protein|tara:strand:- start:286 stop:408 length:123 start_codon:yes stop_codon:yes gene_type:complete
MKKVHLSRAFPDPLLQLFGRFLDWLAVFPNLWHVRRDPQP